jgi:fucose permease
VAEVTGREYRAGFGVAWHVMVFSFGGMIIPVIAYYVRDHFNLMAVFFWPLGLFFLLFLLVASIYDIR